MPLFDILRLQGDHHCACAQKWCHFSFFPRAFKQKKIKALRPKMTKIASRGPAWSRPYQLIFRQCFIHRVQNDLARRLNHMIWSEHGRKAKLHWLFPFPLCFLQIFSSKATSLWRSGRTAKWRLQWSGKACPLVSTALQDHWVDIWCSFFLTRGCYGNCALKL